MGALLVLTGIAFLTGSVNAGERVAAGDVSGAGEDRLNKKSPPMTGGLFATSSRARYFTCEQSRAGHST